MANKESPWAGGHGGVPPKAAHPRTNDELFDIADSLAGALIEMCIQVVETGQLSNAEGATVCMQAMDRMVYTFISAAGSKDLEHKITMLALHSTNVARLIKAMDK
jgi:hypothetical protein